MPKASAITKEMIINAGFEIVRADGFIALSARNVAKKIGCSTQPIYWMYENMEVLKQDVIQTVLTFLNTQISSYSRTGKPFLDLGLGYVKVAFTDSVLFKTIYVENVTKVKLLDIVPDEIMLITMRKDKGIGDVSDKKLKELAVKAWIFVHGLASLVAVGMMEYNEEKIEALLSSLFKENK